MHSYNIWITDGHELFIKRVEAEGIIDAVKQAKEAYPTGEITKVEFALPKKNNGE